MAKAADQVRASDVTLWGVVALICWGVAVLAGNLSPLLPSSFLASLHSPRLEGGSLLQLRSEVAAVAEETLALRRQGDRLEQRLLLAEQARGEVTRRVGALEVSLPALLESVPEAPVVDLSTTASINATPPETFAAEGGSVSIIRKPLAAIQPRPEPVTPPPPATADPDAFAVALGDPVLPAEAEAEWLALEARIGTLLLGLGPLLAPDQDGMARLVAGPLASQALAAAVCDRSSRVGIPCETVSFVGEPLPLLN